MSGKELVHLTTIANLKSQIECLSGDLDAAKNVIRRDEDILKQWESRAREAHDDIMRVANERDEAKAEVERLGNILHDVRMILSVEPNNPRIDNAYRLCCDYEGNQG